MKQLFVIIIIQLCIGCSYNNDDECLERLNGQFVTKIDSSNIINLNKEINCFEWDSLMFVEPSDGAGFISENTHIHVSAWKLMGFKSFFQGDFYNHMIFLKESEVVGAIELTGGANPENMMDGTKDGSLTPISRKHAIFKFYRNSNDTFVSGKKMFHLGFCNKKDSLIYKQNGQ